MHMYALRRSRQNARYPQRRDTPFFALFLETLAARKILVLMPILKQNSVFEFT